MMQWRSLPPSPVLGAFTLRRLQYTIMMRWWILPLSLTRLFDEVLSDVALEGVPSVPPAMQTMR